MPRFNRSIIWRLLSAVPPISVAICIAKHGVDVPYLDDWPTGKWLAEVRANGLSPSLLFQQHNEARPVIPHLIQYSLATFNGWDQRYLMWLSLLLACGIAACLYRLARRTLGRTARTDAVALLASLFVFSLLQCSNWLWGHQIILFLPNLCLAAGLLAASSSVRTPLRWGLCALICIAGELSFSNGLLLWPVLLVALWITTDDAKSKRRGAIIWCALATVAIALFFSGYHRPDGFPTLAQCLSDPLRAAQFFLIFLGMPLGWGFDPSPMAACVVSGVALLAIFGWMAWYVLTNRGDRALVKAAAPWLLLGAYVLLSAATATAGRAASLELAFRGRYVTFSTLLPVAILFCGAIVLQHRREHSAKPAFMPAALAVALIILSQLMIVPPAIAQMRITRAARLQAKGGLQLIAILGDKPSVLKKIDPYSPSQLTLTLNLDNAGLFHPRVIRSNRMSNFSISNKRAQGSPHVESDHANITTTGTAFLPDRPADDVILAADLPEGSIAIDFTDEITPDGKFEIHCPLSKVPAGVANFSVWAFDSMTGKAYRLDPSFP